MVIEPVNLLIFYHCLQEFKVVYLEIILNSTNTLLPSTALGRVGLAEDIGAVVAFLCTNEAKWINAYV